MKIEGEFFAKVRVNDLVDILNRSECLEEKIQRQNHGISLFRFFKKLSWVVGLLMKILCLMMVWTLTHCLKISSIINHFCLLSQKMQMATRKMM
jgi:hypothetical protein